MKNFIIFGAHGKIRFLGGGLRNSIYRVGHCLKKGLGQIADLRGRGLSRMKRCFEGGLMPDVHYA